MATEDFPAAPRVNHAYLPKFVGKVVTLVGKVVSTDDSGMTVESTDGVNVVVRRTGGESVDSAYVEVVGTVGADLTIDEARTTYFGNSFDTASYNELVKLSIDKFPTLFM